MTIPVSLGDRFRGRQIERVVVKLPGDARVAVYTVVNVESLGEFPAGSTVTPDDLRAKGLAKKRGRIKILGNGEISTSLTVKAHAFSGSAKDKIEAAGGSVEVVQG